MLKETPRTPKARTKPVFTQALEESDQSLPWIFSPFIWLTLRRKERKDWFG
jgi:hypothetical protein